MFPLVAQWQESGETQKTFCTQHSIAVSVFAYWLRRYRIHGDRNQNADLSDEQTSFVPVRMVASDPDALEVALHSGAVLGFTPVVSLSSCQ